MKALLQFISNWQESVRSAVEVAWAAEAAEAHFDALAEGSESLTESFSKLVEQAHTVLANAQVDTDPKLLPAYVIAYSWAGEAKNFLILWRNILFEQHRAWITAVELGHSEAAALQLRKASREKIEAMALSLQVSLDEGLEMEKQGQKVVVRAIRKWRLQKNPWKVYQEQVRKISPQCREIASQHRVLLAAIADLQAIHEAVRDMVDRSRAEIVRIKDVAHQGLSSIREETARGEAGRPSALASRLEQVESSVQFAHHLAAYQTIAENRIKKLPAELEMAVQTRAGILVVHECNPRRKANQWLESNVLPLLYEIWEITESDGNGVKMAVINARNRAAILSGEHLQTRTADLRNLGLEDPLDLFFGTIENSEEEFDNLSHLVERRMKAEFRISPIFKNGPTFISGAAPSTFDQFNRNRLLRTLQNWGRKQIHRVRNFIRFVEQEEALSISEKCVRYIESRKGFGADSQYASIFLTRGYIGESFCVGRDEEIAHFGRLVDQWKLGYRGSVLVTGKRLSGKSLFGEMVSHRYFPEHTIRIAPGEVVRVEGRRIQVGYDLEKTLTEIRKITLNHRPLIWIDDLELWQDPALPLTRNLRSLRRFLDSYSTDMFFLVSMGNWLRAYLDRFEQLDRIFQAELNLDRMGAASVREAIWVRHSATNRRLVDTEGRELTPQQVTRVTNHITRAAGGVVGEALNLWSASTLPGEANTVINDFGDKYSLPDFVSPDSGLLLSFIMLQKRTQDYHLRKYFGPAFTEKYAHILKRLISVGILERQLDSSLEINRLVVNELGEMLEYHEYLHYRRWKN